MDMPDIANNTSNKLNRVANISIFFKRNSQSDKSMVSTKSSDSRTDFFVVSSCKATTMWQNTLHPRRGTRHQTREQSVSNIDVK
eukprot:1135358-Amphidinium_carterae.1